MSDKDLNTLIKMPLKKIFESEYWTKMFFIWAEKQNCAIIYKKGVIK